MSRFLFGTVVAFAAAVAFAFLLLPIVAIFLQVPIGHLFAQLGTSVFQDALVVSLKTSLIAHALVLAFGTPTAYLIARRRFTGRGLVLTVIELPLVLPPAVAGIGLIAAFGRLGLLGDQLDALGIRGAIAAFESVDDNLIGAARTLGAGPWRVFGRIALPLAAQGLGAASAVALARGLGEFGATIIFAGSLQGVTQTLPLAIYAQFEQDFDVALAIGALFVLVGVCLLLAFRLLGWARSISTSPFRPVASSSV